MFQFKCPIMFSKPVAQLRIPAPLALFASHFCLTMQTQKYSWTSPHKPITEHSLLHPCGPFLHSAASCTSSLCSPYFPASSFHCTALRHILAPAHPSSSFNSAPCTVLLLKLPFLSTFFTAGSSTYHLFPSQLLWGTFSPNDHKHIIPPFIFWYNIWIKERIGIEEPIRQTPTGRIIRTE